MGFKPLLNEEELRAGNDKINISPEP